MHGCRHIKHLCGYKCWKIVLLLTFDRGFWDWLKTNKKRNSFHSSFLYEKANWDQYKSSLDAEMMNLSGEMDINQLDKKISTTILNSANIAIPRSKEKIGRESNFGKPIVEVLKARNFWGKKYREFRDKFTATKYAELEKLAN